MIELLAIACAGLRDQPPGREDDREADRQLGQEHRAPAEPERAPLDQRAAGELAEGGGEAHHHPIEAERPGKFALAGEQRPDRTQHLRRQHRRGDALQDAAGHQLQRARGEAAQGVGCNEARHADQEQPSPAVKVAEAPSGDQEHGIRGGVAGYHQLHLGRARSHRGVDGGEADIDDEEVDRWQQTAGEQYHEREPAPCVRQARGRRYG